MPKHPHILNAASNLLGIALVIIAGLNVSRNSRNTGADEVAWAAAVSLSLSCLLSYLAMRADTPEHWYEPAADRVFLAGLLLLFGSVLVLAVQNG